MCAPSLNHIPLFETLWTVIHQAPLSMELPSQEYWSGLPFPTPGDLPKSGIKPASLALAGGFLTTSTRWEAPFLFHYMHIFEDVGLKFTLRSLVILLWNCSYYKSRYSEILKCKFYLNEAIYSKSHSSLLICSLVFSIQLD